MKPGDMVMLVFACCREGRTFIGWTGVLEDITESRTICGSCRGVHQGAHGWITVNHRGCVPLPWLKKIEPPVRAVDVKEHEEVTA